MCSTFWAAAGTRRESRANAVAALLKQLLTLDWRRKATGRYFQSQRGADGVDSLQNAGTSGKVYPETGATGLARNTVGATWKTGHSEE